MVFLLSDLAAAAVNSYFFILDLNAMFSGIPPLTVSSAGINK
jgi:hypothetical protein